MNNWIMWVIRYLEIGVLTYLLSALYCLPEKVKEIKQSNEPCYLLTYKIGKTGKIVEKRINWKIGIASVIIAKYLLWPFTLYGQIKRYIQYARERA